VLKGPLYLIKQNKLDKAEAVSRRLLDEYPDQTDGLNRLAMVYEARVNIMGTSMLICLFLL